MVNSDYGCGSTCQRGEITAFGTLGFAIAVDKIRIINPGQNAKI